ncbi:MAG: VOC family protein [Patulibacter sp.]|nr:VOC family protein [Patulibacter sp.]
MSVGPIHHAVLSVADLDRSVAFYRDLLGFRVSVSGSFDDDEHVRSLRLPAGTGGRSASVHPKGATAGIVELVEWRVPGGVPSTGPKRPGDVPGVSVLAFEVPEDELGPLRERLLAADVPVYSEPVSHEIDGYGRIRWFACEDPDGMVLEMLALPSVDEVRRRRTAARAGDTTTADPATT